MRLAAISHVQMYATRHTLLADLHEHDAAFDASNDICLLVVYYRIAVRGDTDVDIE